MVIAQSGIGASQYVEEMGLPAVVVTDGRPKATQEAAALLNLAEEPRPATLAKMLGLHVDNMAANPVARAVRGRCVVSDRMIITDGVGDSRVVEVTSFPVGTGQDVVILIRDHQVPAPTG